MDGYEFRELLKANPGLSEIPVIFLSGLNEGQDKLKAFRSGGVDYISKPFQIEEVLARVETHLKLRRAQQAERELLEKTLNGAVRALLELVQLTSPTLAARSLAIREIVLRIATQMALSEPWQFELAATLCLIGCITLPDEAFEKAYSGQPLSPEEDRMFRAHPESAARLLLNIPRLEAVVEMIRGQQLPEADLPSGGKILGARILCLAVELDRRVYRGIAFRAALQQLRELHGKFDPAMLDALDGYSPAKTNLQVRSVQLKELRGGELLEEDVLSRDGKLTILRKGTILSDTLIERLENFADVRGVQEPLRIRAGLRGVFK